MAEYHLFQWDPDGNVVGAPKVVACDSDEEIIGKVRSMLDGHGIEIWHGTRRGKLLSKEK
jgi:hypothetical protein